MRRQRKAEGRFDSWTRKEKSREEAKREISIVSLLFFFKRSEGRERGRGLSITQIGNEKENKIKYINKQTTRVAVTDDPRPSSRVVLAWRRRARSVEKKNEVKKEKNGSKKKKK